MGRPIDGELTDVTRGGIGLVLLAAWVGAGLWWWRGELDWLGVVVAILLTLLLERRYPSAFRARLPQERITIDDEGVFREVSGAFTESVRWVDLCRVSVITTDEGPFAEDLFFALHDRKGGGCLVSQGKAVEVELLPHLQRLPGFDNLTFVRALGSTEGAEFIVWDERDQASPAAADSP